MITPSSFSSPSSRASRAVTSPTARRALGGRGAPVALLVAAFLLTGCFKLARSSPSLRYYALSGGASNLLAFPADSDRRAALPTTVSPAPSAGDGMTLGLRRIDLAAHLASPRVIVRRGETELVMSEFHRWGGDLQDGLNQALATHLASEEPVRAVDVAPWAVGTPHRYLLQLHVRRFEGVMDSAGTTGWVHLQASWDIVRPSDGRVLVRGTSTDRRRAWRVGDYADLVVGLDASLARMAGDIRRCLAAFPNDSTPPARCGADSPGPDR